MTTPVAVPVEVWRVRVSQQTSAWDRHWARLDGDERQRALGYHREADRERFVVGRSTLRELLGLRLHCSPASVRFVVNAFGKPGLETPHSLHFNTSHAGDWVLHAFSTMAPVGIDVEAVPPGGLRLADVDMALATPEIEGLMSLPSAARSDALLALWACKEAYVKAWGQGLSRSLRGICLRARPEGGFALAHDHNGDHADSNWSFAAVEVDAGHVAFLACPVSALQLATIDYRG